jgi:sulfatase modifying factor 1
MLPAWRWFETTDGHALTAAAASFPPNPWGLHDVLGNASEWCADWIGDYPSGACVDPKGPSTGIAHVHRGGSFIASPQMARSAMRQLLPPQLEPGLPCPWIGFRLVAELPAPRAP